MVEYRLAKARVAGSNPVSRSIIVEDLYGKAFRYFLFGKFLYRSRLLSLYKLMGPISLNALEKYDLSYSFFAFLEKKIQKMLHKRRKITSWHVSDNIYYTIITVDKISTYVTIDERFYCPFVKKMEVNYEKNY